MHESAPYSETARLVLKVSLNLGANLSLSLFGVDARASARSTGALAAEREALIEQFGIDGDQFDFPTNGSGTPDSEATPQALVDWLVDMHESPDGRPLPQRPADPRRRRLPGRRRAPTSPAKGHVFAKTGTTILPGEDEGTSVLKAQNFAGYIETKSGRTVAYALMVNDAGPVDPTTSRPTSAPVINDEATISNVIYESL